MDQEMQNLAQTQSDSDFESGDDVEDRGHLSAEAADATHGDETRTGGG